jgi:hypothetical protein
MPISEDEIRTIAEIQFERVKSEPNRYLLAVLHESLRDGLNTVKLLSRRGKAGVQYVLTLYYGLLVAGRAQRLVSEARRAVFGSDAPPFKEWGDAERWLREREREGGLRPELAPVIADRVRDVLQKLDLDVDLESIRPLTLFYSSPDRKTGGFCCFPMNSPLAELRKWTQKLKDFTGWWGEGALAHILMGALPIVFYPVISAPQGDPPHIDATLWPWHLRTMPLLRDMIADGLPRKERSLVIREMEFPQIRPLDAQLLLLMESVGYPPPSRGRGRGVGQGEYWRFVGQQWKKTYGGKMEPGAICKRWERMDDGLRRSLRGPRPLPGL